MSNVQREILGDTRVARNHKRRPSYASLIWPAFAQLVVFDLTKAPSIYCMNRKYKLPLRWLHNFFCVAETDFRPVEEDVLWGSHGIVGKSEFSLFFCIQDIKFGHKCHPKNVKKLSEKYPFSKTSPFWKDHYCHRVTRSPMPQHWVSSPCEKISVEIFVKTFQIYTQQWSWHIRCMQRSKSWFSFESK